MTLIKERTGFRGYIDIIEIAADRKSFIRAHLNAKEVVCVHFYPIGLSDKVIDNMINRCYWKIKR